VPVETLARRRGHPGRALTTTLDRRVQAAAEEALRARTDEAALVAVEPSTGNVLAVATRPVESSYDRALEGTYAPGSTFKVISTAALLRDGLSVRDTVACPPTIEAGGRRFKNFEGGAAGAVPFSRDFAVSCNTAFVSLAPSTRSSRARCRWRSSPRRSPTAAGARRGCSPAIHTRPARRCRPRSATRCARSCASW
jgi:cell division protein FtsI/penicillin-binding protein 2